jgi:hypothetical protein
MRIAGFVSCLFAVALTGAVAQTPHPPAAQQAPRPSPPPLAGAPAPATAPALSEEAKALLGTWEFSNADRDKICAVTLKADPAALGYKIEFDNRCPAAFPIVNDIVGWRFTENELLRFLDSAGKALVEFSEVENGIYEAPTPGLGVLFLQNAAAAAPPPVTAEQMTGDWQIQRGNKTLCTLTLLNRPAGDDGLALQVQPGCENPVAQFKPTTWLMDRGELLLLAPDATAWRFALGDGAVWRRVPERADSLSMIRK